LQEFSSLCRELGEKENVVAGAWLLANPTVSSIIIGVRTLEQLEDLDRTTELVLQEDVVKKISDLFPLASGRRLRNNLPAPEAYAW